MNNGIKIIILAGGKGARMSGGLPKALTRLKGKPMIKHLLESVEDSRIDKKPTIIVGYKKELVIDELNKDKKQYEYVNQEQQLGSGHAVIIAQKAIEDNIDKIVILYSDHPFVKAETIKKLVEKSLNSKATITMATVKLPDFENWRSVFYNNFSRIIRNEKGNIIKDVQFKDANEEEKKITEVNPCYFCFEARWLWENLKKLSTNNAQKEYYLTDLIKIATEEKMNIESIEINPYEALGANTKEELAILESINI